MDMKATALRKISLSMSHQEHKELDQKVEEIMNGIPFTQVSHYAILLTAIVDSAENLLDGTYAKLGKAIELLGNWQILDELKDCWQKREFAGIRELEVLQWPPSVLQLTQLQQQRKGWNTKFSNNVPSDAGKLANFASHQESGAFLFDRPPGNAAIVPVTLHHPVFGNFLDDCETYQPTAKDNAFALNFSQKMSDFFKNEAMRNACARQLLTDYGLPMDRGSVGKFTTDGDLRENGFVYAILGTNLGGGAEPILQLGWSYAASMNEKNVEYPTSNLPCLLIYLVGAHIGFAGAVWTGTPALQVLGPILPLFYHYGDLSMRKRVSRTFGAVKKACTALKDYYGKELQRLAQLKWPVPGFPHPHEYKASVDGITLSFTYLKAIDQEKLIFHGKCANEDICIKFVRRYSIEAHKACVSIGCAPALRGFECIPGGWFMVMMDYIGESHRNLEMVTLSTELMQTLFTTLERLHHKGYVHGNILSDNIMVPKDGEGIMLVDFDWGGRIGEVKYPMNMNLNIEGGRPDGVSDGEYILANHDIDMACRVFKGLDASLHVQSAGLV